MVTKVMLEESIKNIEAFIILWNKMGSTFFKCANSGSISREDEVDFRHQLDELNLTYPKIGDLVSRYVRSEYYDPITRVHVKNYNVIIELLLGTTSLEKTVHGNIGMRDPFSIGEFEKHWNTARSYLISLLGFVKETLENLGNVTLQDYLRLKDVEKRFERIKSIDDLSSFIENIGFLKLGADWSLATIALQIQEVATMKIAERLNIELDKDSVESILGFKIKENDFGFARQYEALSKKIHDTRAVDMPTMTTDLRSTRRTVLHYGYNPQPEEVTAIVEFTKGFLDRLKTLS